MQQIQQAHKRDQSIQLVTTVIRTSRATVSNTVNVLPNVCQNGQTIEYSLIFYKRLSWLSSYENQQILFFPNLAVRMVEKNDKRGGS
jgi:intergrase/recombinase